MLNVTPEVEKIHRQTQSVLKNSHSPYSGLQVACALKLKGQDQPVFGVNVENASYGATICAERSAIVRALSEKGGPLEIDYLLVISSYQGEPISPCGICLQVLAEFVTPQLKIYLGDCTSVVREGFFKDFLPQAFSKESLPG